MKIGLASSITVRPRLKEDLLLEAELRRRGFEAEIFDWEREEITNYEIIVIRTTWDYHLHESKFRSWLKTLKSATSIILNPVQILEWNIHKSYLLEVEAMGCPIIPSTLYRFGEAIKELPPYPTGWIIKPCVSAGAFQTAVFGTRQYNQALAFAQDLCQTKDLLIQPFVTEITSQGEWSLIFFNGAFSHSVLKKAKMGDFRVQSDHGGSVHFLEADQRWINAGEKCLNLLPQLPIYARVDGLEMDGVFRIMELELLEPELFLDQYHGLQMFADAIEQQITHPIRR